MGVREVKNIVMINKATLKAICERKRVSNSYLAKEIDGIFQNKSLLLVLK